MMTTPPSTLPRTSHRGSTDTKRDRQRKAQQSQFAIALQSLLDDTHIFDRRNWAHFLGISESAISQWVNDRTLPSPERLKRILEFLRDSDNPPTDLLKNFSKVCSIPARDVSPLSTRLGDATTFDQYMLRQLADAFHSTLSTLSPALQEQTLLLANEAARRASRSRAATVTAASDTVTARLHALVNDKRVELGADSVCFYVADPLLNGDLRLALQSGVRHPETLYGPRFPLKSHSKLPLEQDQLFVKDAQSARALRSNDWDTAPASIIDLIKAENLFGDFIAREHVQSCARLQSVEQGRVSCLLFVNYSSPSEFPTAARDVIKSLFDTLREEALPIFTSLYSDESLGQELHMLTIALQSFLTENKRSDFEALERGLKVIIQSILGSLGLLTEDTLGSIHLFEKDSYALRPAAQVAPQDIDPLPLLYAHKGVGLISWAAVRRRAIMVNDLRTSAFGSIYKPIRKETRSELALPMFAGGDLVAVLNIESSRPNVFSPQIVRTLALAASQMAISWLYVMHGKYLSILEQLLRAADRDMHRYLTTIADVAANLYEESSVSCDVWRYDTAKGTFDSAGVSNGASFVEILSAASPRKGGWSHYVVDNCAPVFIHRIVSRRDFGVRQWNGVKWVDLDLDSGIPRELNNIVVTDNIKAQIGFPIMSDSECRGVLWLKFTVDKNDPPPTLIRALEMIGRNAGPKLIEAA